MNDLNVIVLHINKVKWEIKDITKHTFKGLSTGLKGESLEDLLGDKTTECYICKNDFYKYLLPTI